jgi:hypothetical protein
MEGIDHLPRCRAQRDMGAGAVRLTLQPWPMIEPELGIAFAKSDGPCAHPQLRIAKGLQNRFIEACGSVKVGNRN